MSADLITTDLIGQFVADIERDYRSTLGLILSEFDAQCLLFAKIKTYLVERGAARLETSTPGVFASPLHTEIKFLNSNRRLMIKPDITVLDVRDVSLTDEDPEEVVLRKGFRFYGSCFAIEVKFCKCLVGINPVFAASVRRDCEKLAEIRNRLYPASEVPTMRGCVVVFNRTDMACGEFQALRAEYAASVTSKIIYATASLGERHA